MVSKCGSFFEPYNPFLIFFDLMFRVKIIIKIMQEFNGKEPHYLKNTEASQLSSYLAHAKISRS